MFIMFNNWIRSSLNKASFQIIKVTMQASFLGRAKGSSMPYSHKQGSTTARAFIFGRDDSNSRSCLTASENHQNVVTLDVHGSNFFDFLFYFAIVIY